MLGFILFIFYGLITIGCFNYIIKSLFFIRPIMKKYDIKSNDCENNIKGRYPLMAFCFFVIIFFIYCIKLFNNYLFFAVICIYLVLGIVLISKYKKFNILNYLNEFSEDLFDWDKIYVLNINKELKEKCFKIHNKDYNSYKETYLKHINTKKQILELEKNRIEKD